MKLLLTSNGLTNQSISNALFDLSGKPASELKVAFIPTAMHVEEDEKDWFIDNLINVYKQKFSFIDIVDISALPKEVFLPKLEYVDVLVFNGGSSAHLMRWIKESGLINELPRLLETKVYVGSSAGAIVTAPSLALSNEDKKLYYKTKFGYEDKEGLGFVDFYFRPHLNDSYFPNVNEEYLNKVAENIDETIYAMDDNSALKVVDGDIEVITEGEYLILNK